MSSNLPYAADAESPLRPAELQVLRAQYEKEGEYVGTQTKFNYAWGLIKSNQRSEQQLGVQLLSDIFKSEPGRRRECLYYLALGNYKLGNYAEARRFNDLLLVKEPGNLQASSLRQLIDDKVNKEGLMGMAIIGGATVALGLVADPIVFLACPFDNQPDSGFYSPSLPGTGVIMSDPRRVQGERVFCHQCNHEWARANGGIICPICQSEFVEIVSAAQKDGQVVRGLTCDQLTGDQPTAPNSLPAFQPGPNPATTPPPPLLNGHPFHDHNPWADIPDPEEESITPDDFNSGPGRPRGFTFTTRTFRIPGGQATFTSASGHGPSLFPFQHPVFAGATPLGVNNGGARFSPDGNGPPAPAEMQDLFSAIFNTMQTGGIFGDRPLAGMGGFTAGSGTRNGGGLPNPFDLLSAMFSPTGRYGDAVFSQEALDRIIEQLAEQNQGSSAPGPASEQAIRSLGTRKVTEEMMGSDGTAECSICMDDVEVGSTVTELPCKHWFHGDCVIAWLKEHDTCPHCRKPITNPAGGAQAQGSARTAAASTTHASRNLNYQNQSISAYAEATQSQSQYPNHVLGRPSAKFRKFQVFAVVAFWGAYLARGNKHGPPVIRKVSERLSKRITLWQSVVITFLWLYICRNFSKVVGLESPEPLANLYNRSYFRATWITTALDAGFWTAMRIRNKRLRDLASIIFTVYYLIAAEQADEKVRKVRAVITVDHMRVSWNKSTTPYLRAATALMRPKFTKYGPRKIRIPRPKNSAYREPVNAWMYFDGPLSELEEQDNIVLDIPGGGFVSMDPRTSDDKLLAWAGKTRVPILSLDYGKAPEYPYPYALNECFDVYTQIVATKGRCVGMKPRLCPRIIISGDSAGGNLAAGTTIMIIQSNAAMSERGILPMPAGLILIYPALNMLINSWMTDDQMALIRNPRTAKRHENFIKRKSEDIHRNYTPATPMPREKDEANPNHDFFAPRDQTVDSQDKSEASLKPQPLRSRLAVSSILSYFGDRVITPEMMRAMIILYVGPDNRPDFNTDYLLCPIVAPEQILAKFPKTYFLTGERDPLVDDTVIFAGRLRHAKAHLFHERQEAGLEKSTAEFNEKDHVEVSLIPGISHGFLQMVGIFPQGWRYVFKCATWINDIFARPPHAFEGPAIEYRLRPGSLHKDSSSSLELATSVARNHRRTPTTGSEDEDAPLAMSSIKPANGSAATTANGTARKAPQRRDSSSSDHDPRSAPAINRSKSLVSLGSEEDLLKRRMKGLTMSLSGSHAD
ncbi:hypothetical protein DV738_g1253, partial [Chaetothyriales sp. CBS 135597]